MTKTAEQHLEEAEALAELADHYKWTRQETANLAARAQAHAAIALAIYAGRSIEVTA